MVAITFLYEYEITNVTNKDLADMITEVNSILGSKLYVVRETSYFVKRWFSKPKKITYFNIYYKYNGVDNCDVQALSVGSSSYEAVYAYFTGLCHGLEEKNK